MEDKPTFTHLVLSGGCMPAVVYMGSLRYLQQENYYKSIKNIYSTSAGSIFGILFALNISMGDIEKEVKTFLDDPDYDSKISDINIVDFIAEYGATKIENNPFIRIFKIIMKKYNYKTYTFLDLAKNKGIDLNIKAINYDTMKLFTFNVDNSPNVLLIDAACASCCVPFACKPYKIGNELYIDGGLSDNIPVNIDSQINKDNIIILTSTSINESTIKVVENNNIINYFINLLSVISSNMNAKIILKKNYKHFISFQEIPIEFAPVILKETVLHAKITSQDVENLVITGYEQTYNHFKNFTAPTA